MARPKMEINPKCGERLAEIISESGLSQKQAAEILHVSPIHLNNIIKARKRLTYELAYSATRLLPEKAININWLLGSDDKNKTEYERDEAERVSKIIKDRFDSLNLVELMIQRHGYEVSEETDENGTVRVVITSPKGAPLYLRTKEYMSFLRTIDNLLEGQLLLMFKQAPQTAGAKEQEVNDGEH